jgi:hypothetical protein
VTSAADARIVASLTVSDLRPKGPRPRPSLAEMLARLAAKQRAA